MGLDSKQELEDEVRRAFATTRYPGDDALVTDPSGYDPESVEVAAHFRGREWTDISVEDVRRRADSLPLLTPEAFHYYLPAYILHCTKSPLDLDVAPTSLVVNLRPPKKKKGGAWEHFWARASLFSANQARALVHYLELEDQRVRGDWASAGVDLAPPTDDIQRALAWWRTRADG